MNYGLQYGNDRAEIKHQESMGFGSSVNCWVVHLGFIQFILLKRKEKKASKKTNTYSQCMQLLCLFLPIAVPKENPMLCTYRRQKKREKGGGGCGEEI